MSKDPRPVGLRLNRDRVVKKSGYWFVLAADLQRIFWNKEFNYPESVHLAHTHREAIHALDVARGRVKP
ncbi:hypothetical protein [Arthrobacter woluwensis]|uniref:Uncharacterized protein n=1 Tax=Arthrobacter woluwensis TaxID=156980 RepID=A0A1H4WQH4_9MICC|nr:hypothetical protein [Arthrobacter woluwensis]SEB29043.1 hypothetical protein SAMN04489745_0041 [Arthrobacter woluwensis]SEC53629.1 hypothetical protein SAMN04489745_3118 [Arthrobacter woluwensis]SEC90105.1 hypothetical protein SAMN04489745_3463 [Arthrobacter woluwensis]SEC95559.1 hypothetical protein SAMN04489745_3541 [Arthrobacter woluwensis]